MSPISFNTPLKVPNRGIQLSKKACLFRVYRILYSTTQFCGDYFINHDIRIPSLNNQDSMESKAGFQFVTQLLVVCCCPPRGPSSVRTFGRSPAAIMRTGCQWRGWKFDWNKTCWKFLGVGFGDALSHFVWTDVYFCWPCSVLLCTIYLMICYFKTMFVMFLRCLVMFVSSRVKPVLVWSIAPESWWLGSMKFPSGAIWSCFQGLLQLVSGRVVTCSYLEFVTLGWF